jgi:hypothetical protein
LLFVPSAVLIFFKGIAQRPDRPRCVNREKCPKTCQARYELRVGLPACIPHRTARSSLSITETININYAKLCVDSGLGGTGDEARLTRMFVIQGHTDAFPWLAYCVSLWEPQILVSSLKSKDLWRSWITHLLLIFPITEFVRVDQIANKLCETKL